MNFDFLEKLHKEDLAILLAGIMTMVIAKDESLIKKIKELILIEKENNS